MSPASTKRTYFLATESLRHIGLHIGLILRCALFGAISLSALTATAQAPSRAFVTQNLAASDTACVTPNCAREASRETLAFTVGSSACVRQAVLEDRITYRNTASVANLSVAYAVANICGEPIEGYVIYDSVPISVGLLPVGNAWINLVFLENISAGRSPILAFCGGSRSNALPCSALTSPSLLSSTSIVETVYSSEFGQATSTRDVSQRDIRLVSNVTFSSAKSKAQLSYSRIENNRASGTSGEMRLELWAFSTPFTGGEQGVRLATSSVGTLSAGFYKQPIGTPMVTAIRPPNGKWFYSMFLTEQTVGYASNEGFKTVDSVNFPRVVTINSNGPAEGLLSFSGNVSYFVAGDTATFAPKDIINLRATATGKLRMSLWAFARPFDGAQQSGYRVGLGRELPALPPSSHFFSIDSLGSYAQPPAGDWYYTLFAEEYDANGNTSDGFGWVDYRTFPNPVSDKPRQNYQDLWWGGAAESGWGINITQHGNTLFGAVYVYDLGGKPTWYVLSGGTWDAAKKVYSSAVYSPTGSPLNAYDASQFRINASVGNLAIDFTNESQAVMNYTINGFTAAKKISRLAFAQGRPVNNFSDTWWGGTTQNGWGVTMTQQGQNIFAVWFTYDASGKPIWYMMPDASWTAAHRLDGKLYSTRSSAWLIPNYDAAKLSVIDEGSFSLEFTSSASTTMRSIIRGSGAITNTLVRLPF